jgi:hypothetical protein
MTFSAVRSVEHQKEELVRSCFFASFQVLTHNVNGHHTTTFITAAVKSKVPSGVIAATLK